MWARFHSGFQCFADVLSHSYQNGAHIVVQVNPEIAVWLNGATAAIVNDFRIVSKGLKEAAHLGGFALSV